jgi:DNA repair protein RecN (Recombination protein N)
MTASDRVEELARMLGGVEVTSKAREHAKEMLKVAANNGTGDTQKQKTLKSAAAKRR